MATRKFDPPMTRREAREIVTLYAQWPIVEVDGARVPASALTYTSSGVTATVPLRPGAHTVRVRTAQLCWICVGRVGEFDLTRRFFVTTSATTVQPPPS